MNLWRCSYWTLLCGLTLAVASCSSGSSGGSSAGTVQSSLQDLTQDPDGLVTVVNFSRSPLGVDPSYFTADGGQSAVGAVGSGKTVTVTWDSRVSPSHVITVTGMLGVYDGTTTPSSSNSAAPTFTITDSSMVAGLGGDTLEVTFSGARVVEADAEDFSSWNLAISGTAVDLTGSTFTLDVATQVMDITLGASASLHPNFTLAATSLVSVADTALAVTPVAGTASGDASAPTLTSVTQNLTADEYGRAVDFTFDESMDPTFSESIANFAIGGGNVATTVTQPSAGVLRVTFNSTVLPGTSITASNMMDSHGNSVVVGAQAVTQPSPVANSFVSNDAVTVENIGGDYVEAVFAQAFTPSSAEDPNSWTLTVDTVPVVMGNQVISYDFLAKTLRIDLDFDMVNGTAFTLTGVAVQEVDGQTFSAPGASTVAGDATQPTVVGALQNRTQDPTGYTLDVTFSEDIDGVPAAVLGNWTIAGLTVSNATPAWISQRGAPDPDGRSRGSWNPHGGYHQPDRPGRQRTGCGHRRCDHLNRQRRTQHHQYLW